MMKHDGYYAADGEVRHVYFGAVGMCHCCLILRGAVLWTPKVVIRCKGFYSKAAFTTLV